jgi:hypothetical protein
MAAPPSGTLPLAVRCRIGPASTPMTRLWAAQTKKAEANGSFRFLASAVPFWSFAHVARRS